MEVRREIDYSTRDYEGFRNDMIEMLKKKLPEYSDFSQSDAGIVLIELLAHGLDILSFYNDVVANEVFLSTARERESIMKLVGYIGYNLRYSTPAKFKQVFEIEPQPTPYTIPKGLKVMTKRDDVEPQITFELDEDLVIPAGKTGLETDENGEYLYSVGITQGETITMEVVGTSRNVPDQEFKLGYKPVIVDSIKLYVDEGAGLVRWNRVESFVDSDVDKRDFVVRINEQDEAFIQFGNGVSGRIPERVVNGIRATYRIGGGQIGNVAPNTITELPNKPAVVIRTFNPKEAYEKGRDKESIESAKIKAPAQLRAMDRAVTIQDFKDLALTVDFVSKSQAIYDKETNKISIYALPDDGEQLTEKQIKYLEDFFDERILLGTSYVIEQPQFQNIDLSLRIKAGNGYKHSTVREVAEGLLEGYFSLGRFGFGEEIQLFGIIDALMGYEGIRSVIITDPTDDILVDETKIPVIGNVVIEITGGIDDE